MKKLWNVLLLCGLLALSGCATTYQQAGFTGGYQDFRASNEQYFVYFGANGYTSAQTAYQFFLTRAAEIAKDNGYPYFYVLQTEDVSRTETYVTPGSSRTTGSSNVYGTYSRYGNVGYLNANVYSRSITTYTPPQVYNVNKPGFRGQILLVKDPIEGQAPPFDANLIYGDGMDLKASVDSHNQTVGIIAGVGTVLLLVVSVAASGH